MLLQRTMSPALRGTLAHRTMTSKQVSTWKQASFIAVPALSALTAIFVYRREKAHWSHYERPEWVEYPWLNIRKRPFPWEPTANHTSLPLHDIMNDVMSVGIHRVWKDWFVSRLNPKPGSFILDGAGGTGDIAFRILDYVDLGCYHTASHMAGNDNVAANTTIPIGKPLFTIGQGLNKFGLLEPTRNIVSQIPIVGESFKNHASNDTNLTVTIADINREMLSVGQDRATKQNNFVKFHEDESLEPVYIRNQQELYFKEMNLEHINQHEEENSFDYFTIAFGIRNCTNLDVVLKQAYKSLKPGGKIQILEFSHVSLEPLATIYNNYSFKFIPVFGEIITGDYESYQYLVESIQKFPKQDEFLAMVEEAGFTNCEYENLTGGICAIHSGYKPLEENVEEA